MIKSEKTLAALLKKAERLATERADGHLTIMRFTTGWKIMLGTPETTIEFTSCPCCEITGGGYAEIKKLQSFQSLEAALEGLFREKAGTISGAEQAETESKPRRQRK